MFDETQPQDMFADTDAAAPQMTSPTQPSVPMPSSSSPQTTQSESPTVSSTSHKREFPWKPIVIALVVIVVIVGAFYVSMRILNSRTQVTPKPPATASPVTPTPAATESLPAATESVQPTVAPAQPSVEVDTDKDGLTDAREAQLGTNPNNADTDSDGLFDREEVDVYKTNPLNPDTDGDGFMDGAEVKNGYNPNGTGKLLELPNK